MDRREYEHYAHNCRLGKKPPCSCACPLNLDVRAIVEYLQAGNFTAAYKTYRNQAVFPGIVCRVCGEPCRQGCVRKEKDSSVSLKLLERALVDYTTNDTPPKFSLPQRNQKIVIIGGGLAGLTCALRFGTKKYDVTLYEKNAQVGGRLHQLMDPEIFLPEIERQMQFARCNIVCNREIKSLEEIEFDALLIATGEGGEDFGLLEGTDEQCFATQKEGVFLCGGLMGAQPVEDIGQAAVASHSIEKYVKIKKMDGIPESFLCTQSCIEKNMDRIEEQPRVIPENGECYSQEEAVKEAGRCLRCDCTECSEGCELFGFFQKSPQLMVGEALTSLHSRCGPSKQSTTQLISSCNLCGFCKAACPENIDIGQMARDFRHFKSQDKNYPPAYHEFFIRDMNFSIHKAGLKRLPPQKEQARYLFFPGCQLGASDPRYVAETYGYLLSILPDTGIMLGCCGAPADWGGNQELNTQVVADIKETWEEFGRPTMVYACPTCKLQMEKFFPEAEGISLYELMNEHGAPKPIAQMSGNVMNVFDPCASREDKGMQQGVRELAQNLGISLEELRFHSEKARCCGWGGHIVGANLTLADRIVENRIRETNHPYITYCTNCRDTFADKGKECVHILDLVFGMDRKGYVPPSLGERQANRLAAKKIILQQYFGENWEEEVEKMADIKLNISPELMKKLNRFLILEEEVAQTVAHCEATGEKLYDPERDVYMGHLRIGIITYWVEYQKTDNAYTLVNAYSHRMEILKDSE